VRRWYRAGVVEAQRRNGGGYLVSLADVVRVATTFAEPSANGVVDAATTHDEVRRLAADLEDALQQIEVAREQLRAARQQAAAAERTAAARVVAAEEGAAEARREIEFLRTQFAEVAEESRELRHAAAALEAELAEVRRAATFGSVTSTEWIDTATDGYRGPLRPQAPSGEGAAGGEADDLLPSEGKARSGRKARK
jgi:hypothetical protein